MCACVCMVLAQCWGVGATTHAPILHLEVARCRGAAALTLRCACVRERVAGQVHRLREHPVLCRHRGRRCDAAVSGSRAPMSVRAPQRPARELLRRSNTQLLPARPVLRGTGRPAYRVTVIGTRFDGLCGCMQCESHTWGSHTSATALRPSKSIADAGISGSLRNGARARVALGGVWPVFVR
jgi:hypothetical protein